MKQQSFEAGEGVYRIEAAVLICGRDISVAICGGDTTSLLEQLHWHLPRMSLAD